MPAARFVSASDRSLLVYLDEQISISAHRLVLKLLRLLESEPIAGVRNLHPAYCSVLVKFDPLKIAHGELETILRSYLQRLDEVHLPELCQVQIPVRYGGDSGPDLDEVAKIHGMTRDQVIELHSSPTYVVYFLGFVPGFAYLGGLPEKLATPRLASPRRKVPAGSVGIGGNQTGIYPFETPGGWRLIGRTSMPIFQPGREDMCLFSIGDHVRFTAL